MKFSEWIAIREDQMPGATMGVKPVAKSSGGKIMDDTVKKTVGQPKPKRIQAYQTAIKKMVQNRATPEEIEQANAALVAASKGTS
jgi:hypothetical protein